MPHLKITNGQSEIYSIGQLRRDNPNTSFPKSPSDALLAGWGVYPYTVQDQPTADYMTQTLTQTALAQVNGAWVQGWEVSNRPTEDANRNIRSHRDNLLQQTDWMALSDVTMTPEWAAYRQALRDVTAQTGFPFAVEWPTKPE
tara:strand:+ start:187 stop:615 length:429 start_codon:yes stop_codon:yes gene_type:complete